MTKQIPPKRVIVQFIIDERGNISKPIILRSINPELDKEALRIVSLMPQWKPQAERESRKSKIYPTYHIQSFY